MFDFEPYIHQVSIDLKDIGHIDNDEENKRYYRVSSTGNLEEVLQSIPIVKGLCLAVEDNEEGQLGESGSAQTYDRQLCSYFLLKKFEINDMADRNLIKRELKTTNEKIISRLRRDYKTDHEETTAIGLRNLEWSSVSYFTFGPVFTNMLGLHCSFTLLLPKKFIYNAADWNS